MEVNIAAEDMMRLLQVSLFIGDSSCVLNLVQCIPVPAIFSICKQRLSLETWTNHSSAATEGDQ